jgi:hypothetical protein
MHPPLRLLLLAALAGCSSGPLGKTPNVDVDHLTTTTTGQVVLRPEACAGIDLKPETGHLDENALVDFLKKQGAEVSLDRVRSDLVYADVRVGAAAVRLRIASLPGADTAGEELHHAIAQQGAWGVHRSNLAVLAPAGSTANVLAFALRTKLACWGVLTLMDGSEAIVVPGGYREL